MTIPPISSGDSQLTFLISSRYSFERLGLVYVRQSPTSVAWLSPSACLWSSSTSIAGKATISGLYPELKPLFTQVLGVSHITLDLVYEELLKAESVNASASQVKRLLRTLNSLLPTASKPPRPGRLLQSRCFPVRAPGESGAILISCEAEFFIVDRDDMFASFGDRVRCLDFSLNEVCDMKPFFEWAGLESKFLSRSIEEVSRVHGGIQWPIRDRKRDIRRKAYGLLRCVLQFPHYHLTRPGEIANSRPGLPRGTRVPGTRPTPRGYTPCSAQPQQWKPQESRPR